MHRIFILCSLFILAACAPSTPGELAPKARLQYTPEEEVLAAGVDEGYERPPVFKAKRLLPPELLKSPIHTVESEVFNDGYMNFFTVKSAYGNFQTIGADGVALRIREIEAIRQLKELDSSTVFTDTATKTGVNVVTAPVRAVGKVASYVVSPGKAVGTLGRISGGVLNLFSRAADTVGDGAVGVYDAGSSLAVGDTSSAGDTLREGGEFAGRQLGLNDQQLEWYKTLELDPYSHNEPLVAEIDRISNVTSAAKIGFRFIPVVRGITAITRINQYLGYGNQVLKYENPRKLGEKARNILSFIGIPENEIDAFFKNEAIIPPLQNSIALSLQELSGVKNRAGIIEMMANVENRAQATIMARSLLEIVEFHQNEHRFDRIIEEVRLPAAVTKSGHVLIPLPVDHLTWTKANAVLFSGMEERVKKEHGIVGSTEIRISGSISPMALEAFEEIGIDRIAYHRIVGQTSFPTPAIDPHR